MPTSVKVTVAVNTAGAPPSVTSNVIGGSEPASLSAAGSVPTKSSRSISTLPVPVVATVIWRLMLKVPPGPVGWVWLITDILMSLTAGGGGGGGADVVGGGAGWLDDGGGFLVVGGGGGGA